MFEFAAFVNATDVAIVESNADKLTFEVVCPFVTVPIKFTFTEFGLIDRLLLLSDHTFVTFKLLFCVYVVCAVALTGIVIIFASIKFAVPSTVFINVVVNGGMFLYVSVIVFVMLISPEVALS